MALKIDESYSVIEPLLCKKLRCNGTNITFFIVKVTLPFELAYLYKKP